MLVMFETEGGAAFSFGVVGVTAAVEGWSLDSLSITGARDAVLNGRDILEGKSGV